MAPLRVFFRYHETFFLIFRTKAPLQFLANIKRFASIEEPYAIFRKK